MLKLPSEMSISDVQSLHTDLLNQLPGNDPVCLDISEVTRIDTACIQLLCALQKTLHAQQRMIAWYGHSAECVQACSTLGVAEFLAITENKG